MPTNQQRKKARQDVKLKMKLEKGLARSMTFQFNDISDKSKTNYNTNKNILDLSIFLASFQDILTKHYLKVANQFIDRVNKFGIKLTDQELSILENSISLAANSRGLSSSRIILKNLQSDLDDSFQSVIDAAIANGIDLTVRNTSVNALSKFRKKVMNRAKVSIPMTETQNSAESTKLLVAKSHQNSSNNKKLKAFFSTWVTRGDKKVREFHMEADGQTQPMGEPFLVGGQMLLHPGDSSLGATPDNFMNCRCSLQITQL